MRAKQSTNSKSLIVWFTGQSTFMEFHEQWLAACIWQSQVYIDLICQDVCTTRAMWTSGLQMSFSSLFDRLLITDVGLRNKAELRGPSPQIRPVFNIRRLHGCFWCELQGLAYYDCRTIHPSLWRCMLCGSASHSSCVKAWHYNSHRNHRIQRLKNQATSQLHTTALRSPHYWPVLPSTPRILWQCFCTVPEAPLRRSKICRQALARHTGTT